MSMSRPERRARMLSGVPRERTLTGWKRYLLRPWGIGVAVALPIYAFLLWRMYKASAGPLAEQIRQATKGQVTIDVAQINEAIGVSARLALPTLAAYVIVFWLLDRIRPTSWGMRVLALGWGACVSTYLSLIVNSWAGELMSVGGAGDPGAASRPAVFAAPFVEETAKTSIIFLLAILARYRLVAPPQILTLTGLSAVGFAFTENILYYFRVKVYSSTVIGSGDSDAAMRQIVMMRGLLTSFGHPTFSMMTAIGLVVALRTRSKWVRIVAPLAGFAVSATLHMLFNGFATVMSDGGQQTMIYVVGWLFVVVLVGLYVRQLFRESRRMRSRLYDYAVMGWITQRDTEVFSHLWWRAKLIWAGAFRGWRVFRGTIALERRMTELAYLRDQMVMGTVDAVGDDRSRELVDAVRQLRGVGLDEPVGLTIIPRPILGKFRAWLRARRARRRGIVFPTPVGQPVGAQAQPNPMLPPPRRMG